MQAVGVSERARGAHQAVAIRVCLDDGPDEPAARVPAREREIAAHRQQVDNGGNRAWHWN